MQISSNTREANYVHKFTNYAQMRFAPKHYHSNILSVNQIKNIDPQSRLLQNYYLKIDLQQKVINQQKNKSSISQVIQQEKTKGQNLMGLIKSMNKKKQNQLTKSQLIEQKNKTSSILQFDKTQSTFQNLSYCINLSQNVFLIGNQNQIDMFQIMLAPQDSQHMNNIFTQNYWSLDLDSGPIQSITFSKQNKSQDRLIVIASKSRLIFYRLFTKQISIKPKKIYEKSLTRNIVKVDYISRHHIIVYFDNSLQIFTVSPLDTKHFQIQLLFNHNYQNEKHNYKLFQISDRWDDSIKIFFICQKQDNLRTFELLYKQIRIVRESFGVSPFKKVYDIKYSYKNSLKIHNYSRDIIFLNLDSQIIAIKNGLVIDNVNVNFKDKNCFLKFFKEKQEIVHIQSDKIQVYDLQLSTQTYPQKIKITSKDSIQFKSPPCSKFLKIISLKYGYSLFFQNSTILNQQNTKNGKQNRQDLFKKQIKYWFCVPLQLKIKQKLDQIFPSSQIIQKTQITQLQVLSDMAVKMGMSQKQAYLQIWKRSKKNTQKSFAVLLLISDFQIILRELESTMSTKSLKYRDIYKIINASYNSLQYNVRSQTCNEKDLIDYLKSHFLLLKLKAFKDIQIYRKQSNQVRKQKNNFTQLRGPTRDLMLLNMSVVGFFGHKGNLSPQLKGNENQIFIKPPALQSQIQLSNIEPEEKQKDEQTKDHVKTNKQLKIGIKSFKYYKQMNIKTLFLSQINQFMYNPTMKEHIAIIRYFITSFVLLYRTLYKQLLLDVLRNHKYNLLPLLKEFPQFLPIQTQIDGSSNINEFSGQQRKDSKFQNIWTQFDKKHLESNIFIRSLENIQNRQTIRNFHNNIWMKRNLYTLHGLIFDDPRSIIQIINRPQQKTQFFFLFYSQIFRQRDNLEQALKRIQKQKIQKDPQTGFKQQTIQMNLQKLKELLIYVSSKYKLLPYNLKHYSQIYYIFYTQIGRQDPDVQKYSFYSFVKLSNYELFKLYFLNQKKQKGFLLDTIYQLYDSKLKKGRKIFRKGIEEYFLTQKQTNIADMKVILNRFNNLDKQYQMKNSKLFVVLVKCLMKIIYIGVDNQINLQEQILIYLRDVCFPKSNDWLIQTLRYINRLNREIQILKVVKINMTIQEILQKGQIVLNRIVEHQIKINGIKTRKNYQSFMIHSKVACSNTNFYRASIYQKPHKRFSFFLYLTQTMKYEQLVDYSIQLMNDEFLKQFYKVDNGFRKSLLYYLYNWRLSQEYTKHQIQCNKRQKQQNKFSLMFISNQNNLTEHQFQASLLTKNCVFLNHLSYIQKILKVLSQKQEQRKFIQLQIKYAQIFKDFGNLISYPISLNYKIPTLVEVQTHILGISCVQNFLNKQKIDKLFQILDSMRQMFQPDVEQCDLDKKKNWFKIQIYQIFFYKLIKDGRLKQAVDVIQKINMIPHQCNIVIYPVLIIDQMLSYLPERIKLLLIELISYYFYQAIKLTKIIKTILNVPMTNLELQKYINQVIQQIKTQQHAKSYTLNNQIFKRSFIQIIQNENKNSMPPSQKKQTSQTTNKYGQKFELILQNIYNHLVLSNEQFKKNKFFRILFKIICHSPLMSAKYIFCKYQNVNLKSLRAFFSYLIHQLVFEPKTILNLGKRILEIILIRMTNNMTIQQIIKQYDSFSLSQQIKSQDDYESKKDKFKKSQLLLLQSLNKMDKKIQFYEENDLETKIVEGYLKLNKQYTRKQTLQKIKFFKKLSRGQINLNQYKKNLSTLTTFEITQNIFHANHKTNQKKVQIDDLRLTPFLNICKKQSVQNQSCKITQFQKFVYFDHKNLQAIFQNPQSIKQLIPSKYLFDDEDDNYLIQQSENLIWTAEVNFPKNVPFDTVHKKHLIFQQGHNTRFTQSSIVRNRKKSSYYQQTFIIQKKQKSPNKSHLDVNNIIYENKKSLSNFLQVKQRNEQLRNSNVSSKFSSSDEEFVESPLRSSRNIIKRRKPIQLNFQLKSPLLLKKKQSIRDSLSWGLSQKNFSNFLSKQIITEEINQAHHIVNQLLSIAEKMSDKQSIGSQFLRKNADITEDKQNISELKKALKIIYKNESISLKIRLNILDGILSKIKIQNYVEQYLGYYIKASKIKFIDILDRQFSEIFPFQGLFLTQKIELYQQKRGKDQKQLFQNIKRSKSEQSYFKKQNNSKDILYQYLMRNIREHLNVINVSQMAQILQLALQNSLYGKKVYFELIMSAVETIIQKRCIYKRKDKQIQEFQMINHLIQMIDDIGFIESELSRFPQIKEQQKTIIETIIVSGKQQEEKSNNKRKQQSLDGFK